MVHRQPHDGQVPVRTGDLQPEPAAPPTAVLCVSGGGSRALTAGFGHLSGLAALPDPQGTRDSMLERFDHVSSVSGGSWASVLFTYAPTSISDEELLLTPVAPEQLVMNGDAADPANVEWLAEHSIGNVPQRFSVSGIAKALWVMHKWGLFRHADRRRWFWIIGIGEVVLRPFGLYDATLQRKTPHPLPKRFFGSSHEWVTGQVLPHNPHLTVDDFHLMRPGRAPLLVNMNIIEDKEAPNAVQIPVQVTGEWGGAPGVSVDGTIGGGDVQSLGFTSELRGGTGDQAQIHFARRYGLVDIAGCSSAFFAAFILQRLNDEIEDIRDAFDGAAKRWHIPKFIRRFLVNRVFGSIESFLDADAAELIPVYDYWQPTAIDHAAGATAERGFADGGDFDNSGILGALARTGATRVLSVINAESPVTPVAGSAGGIQVPGSLPLLFGHTNAMNAAGEYPSFGGFDPAEPLSYVQVFSDANGEFDELRSALFEATKDDAGTPWRRPCWARRTFTTIENPVAGIRAGRQVEVMFVVNNRVDDWQEQLNDEKLVAMLADGQTGQSPTAADPRGEGSGTLANFPWYSTAGQIELDREAVNMLAQLSAWNLAQLEDELRELLS